MAIRVRLPSLAPFEYIMTLERRYVTIDEAAAICGVCRRTIYYWITEGFLGVEKRTPSGSLRIDRTTLISESNKRRQNYKENLNGRKDN